MASRRVYRINGNVKFMFRYDIIFDTVGPRHYSVESMSRLLNRDGTFVTIITPVFPYVDKHGLLFGLSRAAYKSVRQTCHVSHRSTRYFDCVR
jgi:hypothetical protein